MDAISGSDRVGAAGTSGDAQRTVRRHPRGVAHVALENPTNPRIGSWLLHVPN